MRNIVAFCVLWLALILESTVFQVPPVNVIRPNLVLIVLAYVALTRGTRAALVLGIAIGLIQDVNFGPFIGLNAFTYGMVGYFAAVSFSQFLNKNIAIAFLVVIVATFIEEWVTYGMTRMFDVTAFTWRTVLQHSMLAMMVNGIVTLMLYPVMLRLFSGRPRKRYKDRNVEVA